MNLAYETLVVGPMGNNVYILVDLDNRVCVIIDPGFMPQVHLDFIKKYGWDLSQVCVTHGHFDHTAGVISISEAF